MVKQLDKKIKKGHYFTGLLILSILLIGLNLFYFISPGEFSASFLFFGTIAIVFFISNSWASSFNNIYTKNSKRQLLVAIF